MPYLLNNHLRWLFARIPLIPGESVSVIFNSLLSVCISASAILLPQGVTVLLCNFLGSISLGGSTIPLQLLSIIFGIKSLSVLIRASTSSPHTHGAPDEVPQALAFPDTLGPPLPQSTKTVHPQTEQIVPNRLCCNGAACEADPKHSNS